MRPTLAGAQQATPVVDSEGTLQSDEPVNQSVLAAAPTVTITKTASNPTPIPGEVVTFTISIEGTADAGTTLTITDSYQISGLSFPTDPVLVSSHNMVPGSLTRTTSPPWNRWSTTLNILGTGSFAAVFSVTSQLPTDGGPGLRLATRADVADSAGAILDSAEADLAVIAPTPILTVTKSASDRTPSSGQVVSFTISVYGSAFTETELTLVDLYPAAHMEVDGDPSSAMRLDSSSNVTVGTPRYSRGDNHQFSVPLTVTGIGVERFGATFTVRMVMNEAVPAGTQIATGAHATDDTNVILASVDSDLTVAGLPDNAWCAPNWAQGILTEADETLNNGIADGFISPDEIDQFELMMERHHREEDARRLWIAARDARSAGVSVVVYQGCTPDDSSQTPPAEPTVVGWCAPHDSWETLLNADTYPLDGMIPLDRLKDIVERYHNSNSHFAIANMLDRVAKLAEQAGAFNILYQDCAPIPGPQGPVDPPGTSTPTDLAGPDDVTPGAPASGDRAGAINATSSSATGDQAGTSRVTRLPSTGQRSVGGSGATAVPLLLGMVALLALAGATWLHRCHRADRTSRS